MIYAADPDAVGDDGFVVAGLDRVVVGTRGRLRDARRTPLSITALDAEHGQFEVRIEAFEDRGTRWRLPLWEISRIQVALDAPRAPTGVVTALRRAADALYRAAAADC